MSRLTPEKLIFLFFLLFFIFVPNVDQGYDSYAFLLDARAGLEIVHPHHLLYNVLRYILFQLSTGIGLEPMKVISLASSLFGAVSLTMVFKILKMKTLPELALTGTMLIGMVYSFWYFSTSVEVNMVSMMFLLISIYYLFKVRSEKNSILAFLFLAIGILFHELLILALIPLFIFDSYRNGSLKRTVKLSTFSLVPGFIIYIIVAVVAAPVKSLSGVYSWLVSYGELGRWGILGMSNFPTSAGGIAKAVFGGSMLRQSLYAGINVSGILYLVGAGIAIIGLAMLLANAILEYANRKFIESTLLIATSAVFAVFAFWWAPQDSGFWLYPVVLILLMIFMSIEHSDTIRKVTYFTMAIFALVNITCAIVPGADMQKSVARRGAAILYKMDLGPHDLVLTNMAQIPLALEYHYNVKVPTTSFAYQTGGSVNDIIARFHTMLKDFQGKIVVFGNEIDPEVHRRFLFTRFSPEDYLVAYAPLIASLQPVDSLQVYGRSVVVYESDKSSREE